MRKVLAKKLNYDIINNRKGRDNIASVNFEKLKLTQEIKAMLRHCDEEMRLKTEHSNIDINKSATPGNMQGDLDYYAACKRFDDRIAYLDAKPGANKRSDRVTCFGLNIPAPKNLEPKDERAFFTAVIAIIADQYGKENIIQYYLHQDEKHEYVNAETGEKCVSRAHMHVYVVPVHNGKLNGKWFSSRANMARLNNSIHQMALEKFCVSFMDGTKRKSRKTVEQLKNESIYIEAQQELDRQRRALDARQTAVSGQEAALKAKAGEIQIERQIIFKTRKELSEEEERLADLEADRREQLQKAVQARDMAARFMQQLQQMTEENKLLIDIGRKQQRRRAVDFDEDPAVTLDNLNKQLDGLTL